MEEHPLRAAILTISNSRTFSDDTNGLLIQSALANYGHQVVDSTAQTVYAAARESSEIHNAVDASAT